MKLRHREPRKYGLNLYILGDGARRDESRSGVKFAQIGREIKFDPSVLDTYHYDGWAPVHHDLLVVCAAVEFADRRCYRRIAQWTRNLSLTIPVIDLEVWQRQEVRASLRSVLRQLTGDEWNFTFVQANNAVANGNFQRALPFASNKQFAIAYSNGLDSLCVSGLHEKNDNAIRVRVTAIKDRVKSGERPFDRIPFRVCPKPSCESSVRSRGFKFSAVTAIVAHLSRIKKVVVPESGQGVFGPVLLPLHNIYADYRNHPVFFRKMEQFIYTLLDYSVAYEQPRLWYTKGQTIAAYLTETGRSPESIIETRSCWQQRWNCRFGGKLRQCGLCAACLLRRMSMHTAGITEPDDTYTISDLTVASFDAAVPKRSDLNLKRTMMIDYGNIGARHLKQLADLTSLPETELKPKAFEIGRAIGATEQQTLKNLRKLLAQHAEEWQSFLRAQGKESFINHWIRGGRHG